MKLILTATLIIFLSINVMAKERAVKIVKEMKGESRIALIIGNKDYSSFNSLKNPINDAKSITEILKKKGFSIISLENASQIEMEEAIDKFAYRLRNEHGIGLFYYAGHGIEVDGINYLIPTDARIPSKKYVKSKSVSTDLIVSAMEEARNRLNILILDSCRSNPFGRGGLGGLAPINSASGIYVAYATSPGKIAEDGDKDNGLFTKYLIQYINQSGLEMDDVFKQVRKSVQRDSNGQQIPWSSSSVYGDFYFTLPKNLKNTTTANNENVEIQTPQLDTVKEESGGMSKTTMIIGGVVAAGAGVGVALASGGGDSSSANDVNDGDNNNENDNPTITKDSKAEALAGEWKCKDIDRTIEEWNMLVHIEPNRQCTYKLCFNGNCNNGDCAVALDNGNLIFESSGGARFEGDIIGKSTEFNILGKFDNGKEGITHWEKNI